jgi:peptide/nickel transport system permease protein
VSQTKGQIHKTLSLFKDTKLFIGSAIIVLLLLFGGVGSQFVSRSDYRLGAAPFSKPPSIEYPLGTDSGGRNLFAMMVYGTPVSLQIGLIAATVGTAFGTLLGLISGYYRGWLDDIVRNLADIMMSIPSLIILVVIASYISATTSTIAIILAVFAWPHTIRSVRAQTLTMREQAFVKLSKLSGRSDIEIIVLDLLPNLLPYIAAGFVSSVSGAILASVGLNILGIGPIDLPTLGLILQNAFTAAALLRGMWWWWLPPAFVLVALFIGLYLISMSLDEIANPRLKGVKS